MKLRFDLVGISSEEFNKSVVHIGREPIDFDVRPSEDTRRFFRLLNSQSYLSLDELISDVQSGVQGSNGRVLRPNYIWLPELMSIGEARKLTQDSQGSYLKSLSQDPKDCHRIVIQFRGIHLYGQPYRRDDLIEFQRTSNSWANNSWSLVYFHIGGTNLVYYEFSGTAIPRRGTVRDTIFGVKDIFGTESHVPSLSPELRAAMHLPPGWGA